MKRILFLLAAVLPLIFVGCSDDENFEERLVGTWVEDTKNTIEVMNLQLNANHTGLLWAEDNGGVDSWGKQSFTWSATEDELTTTMDDSKDTEKVPYELKDEKLRIGEIVYKRK